MADDQHLHAGEKVDAEVKDRGLFDFMGKKKEHHEGEGKCQEEVVAVGEFEKVEGEGKFRQEEVPVTEFDKLQVAEAVEEEKKEEKKEGLPEKLHRSHSSSSSSSSDEEEAAEGEGEKKKKKKKSLKDKIKEKMSGGEKKEGEEEHVEENVETVAAPVVVEDNTIPVEKIDELAPPESEAPEKKSLLDKIKEKLPGGGQSKKPAEETPPPAPPAAEPCPDQGKEQYEGDSPKEKKGFLGKIMDKIPGYHKNNGAAEESSTTQ